MTSMGMRQYGGDSELVIEQPSTEDLSASPNCGSNINLLEAGSSSLHYSNPVSCNFQPATSGSAGSQFSYQQSANTHFQPHLLQQSPQNQSSAETRFNGTPQLSPGKIKKQLSYWYSVFLRAVLEFLPPWNYWNCRHMGAKWIESREKCLIRGNLESWCMVVSDQVHLKLCWISMEGQIFGPIRNYLITYCIIKSLTSEAIPSATQFFMTAYKISHFPGL